MKNKKNSSNIIERYGYQPALHLEEGYQPVSSAKPPVAPALPTTGSSVTPPPTDSNTNSSKVGDKK